MPRDDRGRGRRGRGRKEQFIDFNYVIFLAAESFAFMSLLKY
jgi:hypothetical protein